MLAHAMYRALRPRQMAMETNRSRGVNSEGGADLPVWEFEKSGQGGPRQSIILSQAEFEACYRDDLTGYKLPPIIAFRNELPKMSLDKVLQRAKREAAPELGSL